METIHTIEDELLALKELIALNKAKAKLSKRKYQLSDKGKLSQKKANRKYRPPTGKPRGRPRKLINKL
jgi:hypothetical protein